MTSLPGIVSSFAVWVPTSLFSNVLTLTSSCVWWIGLWGVMTAVRGVDGIHSQIQTLAGVDLLLLMPVLLPNYSCCYINSYNCKDWMRPLSSNRVYTGSLSWACVAFRLFRTVFICCTALRLLQSLSLLCVGSDIFAPNSVLYRVSMMSFQRVFLYEQPPQGAGAGEQWIRQLPQDVGVRLSRRHG